MKKSILLAFCVMAFGMLFAQTDFTATYTLAGAGNDVASLAYNGTSYDGITPSALAKVGIISSSSMNNFRGTDWATGATTGSDVFTGSLDAGKYIGFSIAPVSGYTFTITSITFGIGRSGTGPRQWEWRGSADSYASAITTYDNLATNLTNTSGVLTNPDENANWVGNILSPGAAYQNSATAVEFRLYGYNAEAIAGSGGLQNNITITGTYVSATNASLAITTPVNGLTVNTDEVEVTFSTTNFDLGTDGRLEYKLNGGAAAYTTTSPFTISGLTTGANTLNFQLVDMSNVSLDPVVTATRTVNYIVETTDPSLTITSPANGATINAQNVNIAFTLENFVLGTNGKLSYSLDGGADVLYTGASPIALTGLSYASHTVAFELVDMAGASLSPAVTASLNFTCAEALVGGMEPFDNCSASTTYGDGSFVGNNDITWNFTHSRDEGDYAINGKGLMLRRASDSKLESGPIGGGIGNFELKMRKAFTGATPRQIELYINGELAGTSETFGGFTGADETIYTFAVNNINIGGSFTMKIKCVGDTEVNKQVTIDDISWTQFASTEPYLVITSPANNAIVQTTDVNVVFNAYNFDLGTDGKIKYTVDGGAAQYTTASPIALTGLSEEQHTVALEMVDMSNNSLTPTVTAQVMFTVNTNVPEYTTIYSIQYTTAGSGDSPLVNQEITTRGLVVAKKDDKFWLQDGVGAWNGVYVFYISTPSPAIGDSVWVTATVVEYNNLTELSFASYTLINSGNGSGVPAVISTANAGEEMYEGVLVQIEGVNTAAPDTYGQWAVNDGSGAILVDDQLYDYNPTLGNSYNVTGVTDYYAGERKVLPRAAADVIDLGLNSSPMLSITSPANASTIFTANTTAVFAVSNFTLGTDGKIAYQIDGGTLAYITTTTASITGLTNGTHTISAQLVNMSENPLTPAVAASTNFTVNLSGPVITPIYDIQFSETAPYASPLVNQTVTIEGVVTASFNGTPYGEGYFVQDAAGAWNGLYIFDFNHTPAIGDKVIITGKISEFFEMTKMTNITYYQVTSIGELVPAPAATTTLAAGTEMYESVLIKVQNAECLTLSDAHGEWTVNDGSGVTTCKDNGAFSFQEVVGTHYDITGVILYSFATFGINYRIPSDVVVSTSIETELSQTTRIYPNPASDVIQIVSDSQLISISIITPDGKIVIENKINNTSSSIDISSLASGLYFIRLEGENGYGIKKLFVE